MAKYYAKEKGQQGEKELSLTMVRDNTDLHLGLPIRGLAEVNRHEKFPPSMTTQFRSAKRRSR